MDVKSLQTDPEVMPNGRFLDNQDLYLLFKECTRILRRQRSKETLLFMMITEKSLFLGFRGVRFIMERFDVGMF